MPVPEVVLTAEQKIALFHGVAGWDFEVRRRSHASFDLVFFEVRETPLYAIPSFIFQACFLEEPIYYRHRWIPVGIPLARYPPDGPGRALVSASGSYLG
jgi:hypothetical protein